MSETEDFAELLRQYERGAAAASAADPKVGDAVEGEILAITDDAVFVDLGGKTEGVIERAGLLDADGQLTVAVGERILTRVAGRDPASGQLRLGTQQGRRVHDMAELEQAYREGRPVDGLVTEVVKGGLAVQIAGMRAFCPASQVDRRFVEDLTEFVGQHLSFRITKIEGGRHADLVVSRRLLLEEAQQAAAAETRARLVVGAVFSGTVTTLKDYGAFVDLGGIEGMIHLSELAYGRVKHPSEVLSVGQTVEVAVLRIEPGRGPRQAEKVALSLRALARDPWRDLAERLPVGSSLTGRVARVTQFGAFVELEAGVEGLVHISELGAGRRLGHAAEAVKVDEPIRVTVLAVEPERRRISLSLAAAGAAPASGPGDIAEVGARQRGAPPEKGEVGTFGELLRRSLAERRG